MNKLMISLAAAALTGTSGCALLETPDRASYSPAATGPVVVQANPPGRGRAGGLPPGIAKQVARGKPLPPGIAKRAVPHHVLVGLPPAADGFEYIVVAGKVLLIESATQVVREVLTDLLL